MIVFFTSSISLKPRKQPIYNEIINVIESLGCKLVSLERQTYGDLIDLKRAKLKENKISIHNQYIKKAIEISDAAIFETSSYSFKLGLEVRMCLEKKIPVLCLSDNKDLSKKIQDTCFYAETYDSPDEIRKIIKRFLREVKSKHLSKRMGVFLHNKHINFLKWFVTEKDIDSNRSKVIRDALDKYMNEFSDFRSLK